MISNLLKINYAILLENYNFFISFNLSMLSQHAPVPPVRATQNLYTDKLCGWYVELTDETNDNFKNLEKLKTQIYIYQIYSPKTCIYVNDEYFEEYSDDEWGD